MKTREKYLNFGNRLGDHGSPEDTVLVVDVSYSMDETDLRPNRLKAAVTAANALLDVKAERYPRDCVGLVAFAEDAQVASRLVAPDGFSALRGALDRLSTGASTNITAGLWSAGDVLFGCRVPRTGSWSDRLGRALKNLLTDQSDWPGIGRTYHPGRIILLTDGKHNTGPKPEPVAEKIRQRGIVIDVIGVGGSPSAREFSEAQCKRIASRNPDRSVRYAFIKDAVELSKHFKTLAGHIRRI